MSLSLRNTSLKKLVRGQRSVTPVQPTANETPSGFVGNLNAEQSAALARLSAELAPAMHTPAGATFVERFGGHDRCLLRWLRLTKFDVVGAKRRFEETLRWRIEVGTDTVLENPAALALMERVKPFWPGAYAGCSLDGLPILFVRVGQVRPHDILENFTEEDMKMFYVYWMELSQVLQTKYIKERVKAGKDTLVCRGQIEIYDCSGLSIRQMHVQGLRLLAKMLSIGSQHYPENLYRGFIINIPSVFSMGWKVITPVLNENAKRLITLDSGNLEDQLAEILGVAQLQHVHRSVPISGAAGDAPVDPSELLAPEPEDAAVLGALPSLRQEKCPKERLRVLQRTW